MDEETKKKIEELEERVDELESLIKRLIKDCEEHKHNISDGRATLNY
ncbi:MAG: hypothetical protein KKC19_01210 [Nanoarchaeota archaeon]|nr:hypothetical protein [Nanoarchaeota archaeon]